MPYETDHIGEVEAEAARAQSGSGGPCMGPSLRHGSRDMDHAQGWGLSAGIRLGSCLLGSFHGGMQWGHTLAPPQEFIDYYADAATCEPVRWWFHSMKVPRVLARARGHSARTRVRTSFRCG